MCHFLQSVLIAILLLMSGCASTIGNRSNIEEVTFEVGKTSKVEVAEVLGLPSSRATHAQQEFWGYRKGPSLTGLIYALPSATNQVTTGSVSVPERYRANMAEAAVIYSFDPDGILNQVIKPSSKQ